MQLGHATISTRGGPRRALVVAPDHDEVVGPESLAELRDGSRTTVFHQALVDQVQRDPAPINAVILRARSSDGSGQFRLERTLDEGQLEEVGYWLVRAQLDAWRELLHQPVLVVARVELRVWELAALRTGTARLMAELDTQSLGDDLTRAAKARHDRWLLGHALLNFGVGLETAVRELLPSRLEQLEAGRLVTPTSAAASFPL
jgi:hypothetical protein